MIIENLLTKIGRSRTGKYLTFTRDVQPLLPDASDTPPRLLYLHIPFCEILCPYCSFNRITFEKDLASAYFDSLLVEMEMYRKKGYVFNSVYVGGGTPTVLPERLAGILDRAKTIWPIRQISVETNPNHLSDGILSILKEAGVNRLSVGVQTFNNNLLKKIKRYEKYGSGEDIKNRLREVNGTFDTLNADMIFNFPGQSKEMVMEDLKIVKDLQLDQVTYYPLMASRLKKNDILENLGEVRYQKEKSLYDTLRGELELSYKPASSWCFSRQEGMIDEYIVDYREFAGLGSGSFGYLAGSIYANTFSIPGYIQSIKGGKLPLSGIRNFTAGEKFQYDLLMGLFGGGVSKDSLEKEYGPDYPLIGKFILSALKLSGAVKEEGNTLRATRKGEYYLVILMREFFNGVNNLREERLAADKGKLH